MVVQQSSTAAPPPPIILIVEDDRDTRELYETVFTLEGFWVADAASADAAVDQVALLQPDVIITDVGLPGGCDGVGLARRVHQDAKTADVPVIAVTGRMLSELSPDAEFAEILQKPIYPSELVAAARRVLASSAALREHSQKVRGRVPALLEHSERVLRKSERLLEKWRVRAEGRDGPHG
jgi:DNA-binding response OmpR family regulator